MAELDPTAVKLTPFEVVGGTRREDLVEAPWRYSQHQYTLRILGDEFFGRDVDLPVLTVPYTVQVTTGRETQEGREQTYLLPAIPIRVASLLPANATDIRDASPDSFGTIENRRLRATAALVAGGISVAFAAALVAVAAVRIWRRRRPRDFPVVPALSRSGILDACARELSRLRTETARGGWNADLVERALTTLRTASAVALSHPMSLTQVTGDVDPRAGELLVRRGRLKPKQLLLSARVTADMISRRLAEVTALSLEPRVRDALRTLGESLRVFTAVRYGRPGELDPLTLQKALEEAASALGDVQSAGAWPLRVRRRLARAAALLGGAA
jgi:hypothetical protein